MTETDDAPPDEFTAEDLRAYCIRHLGKRNSYVKAGPVARLLGQSPHLVSLRIRELEARGELVRVVDSTTNTVWRIDAQALALAWEADGE